MSPPTTAAIREPQAEPATAEMGAKLLAFSSIPVIDISALRGTDRAALRPPPPRSAGPARRWASSTSRTTASPRR
uniref:Uncharacterized protein n=1 Tax=Phenylobacterium glaciei TaxID=2803784 RepID=A0A974P584_9CAUL|nr:hypothetical protein JKL49_06740 [Phenylobacterium glaciei]